MLRTTQSDTIMAVIALSQQVTNFYLLPSLPHFSFHLDIHPPDSPKSVEGGNYPGDTGILPRRYRDITPEIPGYYPGDTGILPRRYRDITPEIPGYYPGDAGILPRRYRDIAVRLEFFILVF